MTEKEQILKDCKDYVGTKILPFSEVYTYISKLHNVEKTEFKEMLDEKGWLIDGPVPFVRINEEAVPMEPDHNNSDALLEERMNRKPERRPQDQNRYRRNMH